MTASDASLTSGVQTRSGRRTAWDDWLFAVFGPAWSLLQEDASTPAGVLALVNRACEHYRLPLLRKRAPKEPADTGQPDVSHLGISSLADLPLPQIHPSDWKLLPNTVQLEFVVEINLLADACNAGASFRDSRCASILGETMKELSRVVLQGWMSRMCMLPRVAWRPRRHSTLADAIANMCMAVQHDVTYTDGGFMTMELETGMLHQWHIDGGSRDALHAVSACTLVLSQKT